MQFISRTFQYLLIVPLVLPEQGDMSLFFCGISHLFAIAHWYECYLFL